jgi:CopA family copper-resistance protein
MNRIIAAFIFTIIVSIQGYPKSRIVRYDLYVADTTVNYNDEFAPAISINRHIPGPTLTFIEGDTAEIYVHNMMDVETSIHWHGIILPNEQDGVPYLTTAPIYPHSTHLYRFPIVQHGTYWYHAHTGLQEQSGLYGALVLKKQHEESLPEYTVLFSDWTSENPMEVLRSLKMANDWYAIRKHSTQNWGEALFSGYGIEKIKQEWHRMLPMDVSDVAYDALLANGSIEQQLPQFKAGSKIKLRIINGSSSTYFWLQYAGGTLSVVAADGEDVEPVEVDRMIIGIAETYDVVITIPENMSYEFKATAEDRTKSTSLWLGDGMKMPAPTLPPLNYFEGMKMMNGMMNFDGSMNPMGMQMSNQVMDMNTVMYPEISGAMTEQTVSGDSSMNHSMKEMDMSSASELVTLNYGMLRATSKTTLPEAPMQVFHFDLTGNMNRYQWSINDKAISDTDKILIHKGENIRIILNNQSMMRHPMHIHGHYFRVLNGQGEYSPLKNVLDIMPMEIDTIEFAATYDGDWFFHCHILYHMMSGMGRVFHYTNSSPNQQIGRMPNAWNIFLSEDDMWHFAGAISGQSQGIGVKAMLMNRDYVLDAMERINYKASFESEAHIARFLDRQQFLKLYFGGDIRRSNEPMLGGHDEHTMLENRTVATLGLQYLLPMFITADIRIDHTRKARLQLSKTDWALTSRLRFDVLWNTDNEYELGLRYILAKRWSVSSNYDTHFGFGAGLIFTY